MLKAKLKSSSGATIMLALLVFLLCAMAGSVILAAATAASGRSASGSAKTQLEDEQAYYTLSSAAHMLEEGIVGQTYSRYRLVDDTSVTPYYNEKPQGDFGALLLNAADTIFLAANNATDPIYTKDLTITVSGMDSVKAIFQMNRDYSIVVNLEFSDNDVSSRKMILNIPAAKSQSKEDSDDNDTVLIDGKTYTRQTDTLVWTDAEITSD